MILRILATGALVSLSFSFFTLPSKIVPLLAVNLMFAGICIIPIIPVAYAFAVEVTYPMPETLSNGMMVMIS